MAQNQGLPAPNLPITNPGGTISIPWYQFFNSLWQRTGGGTNNGNVQSVTVSASGGISAAVTNPNSNVQIVLSINSQSILAGLNTFTALTPGLVPASGGGNINFLRADGTWDSPGSSGGIVTTTGSPAAGEIVAFSGASSITNSNLSGDITTSNSLVTTLAPRTYNSVPSAQVVTINNGASPYTIGANDYVILVDTSGGGVTLTLPSPATDKRIKVKDITGSFGTSQCTVARNASEKIEGRSASLVLYANWGNYEFQSNGTDWFKVSGATNLASITYGTAGGTFNCPSGITAAVISGRGGSGGAGGGGAGGGGSTAAGASGGGGGGPGGSVYTVSKIVTISPGTAYTVTVGAAGSAGSAGAVSPANAAGSTGGNGGNGGPGGNTSFGSLFLVVGGFAGGLGAGGSLGSPGGGGFGGEGIQYGTAGSSGGPANTNGTTTSQQFLFSPWAIDGAGGAGGTAGGANGGGGGGGGGNPAAGDSSPPAQTAGGNGGAAGANGSAATTVNASTNGVGGSGGPGGGGGGLLVVTGSQGGAGKAGGAGTDGYLTITWQE